MKELILSSLVVLFFAVVVRADGQKLELPQFPKKVMDQAKDDSFSASAECSEVRDEKGHVKQTTCGAELTSPPVQNAKVNVSNPDLGVHSSDFAQAQEKNLEDQGLSKKK